MDFLASFIASNGIILTSLSLTFQGFDLIREIVQHSATETQKRFNRTYSFIHALALWVFLTPAVEQLERMEDQILHQSDQDILAFKASYSFDCSMIAVAGAIIAQIAVTAFSLPSLSQTHWTARAFFLIRLLSGCLSVVYACLTQRVLARFRNPVDIRQWMRRPPTSQIIKGYSTPFDLAYDFFIAIGGATTRRTIWSAEFKSQIRDSLQRFLVGYPILRPNSLPPEEQLLASIPAAALLAAPSVMLTMSVSCLLTGLVVYLAFTWTRNLGINAGVNDSRNVFIFFIVGLVLCFLFYALPTLYKYLETFELERLQREGDQDPTEAERNTEECSKRMDALLDYFKRQPFLRRLVKLLIPYLSKYMEAGLHWTQRDNTPLSTPMQTFGTSTIPNGEGVVSTSTQMEIPQAAHLSHDEQLLQSVEAPSETLPDPVDSVNANVLPIIEALRAAALAQEQCAEANRKLAIEYAKLDAGNYSTVDS